jgi:hypothetical protein
VIYLGIHLIWYDHHDHNYQDSHNCFFHVCLFLFFVSIN